ncbi:MAG: hypothetical protein GY867_11270 [bacterium]|nr:hypothetical protein [bacterium]
MEKMTSSEYRLVGFMTLAALGLTLAAHFYLDSMFNVGDEGWRFRLQIHQDYYPFSARTFTTYPALWLGQLLGGRFELAFAIIVFSLVSVLGPLLYRYLRTLGFEPRWSIGGLVIFYLSYPILAAFHEPISTWDDFWQYGAQILAFTYLLRRQPVRSAIAFAVGVAAREPSLLIYPIWASAFWGNIPIGRLRKLALLASPPAVAAVIWLLVSHEPAAATIGSIMENFRDDGWTRNSLYSLFMGYGWLWLLAPFALLSRRVRDTLAGEKNVIRYGSLWGTLMVVGVVLTSAYARETRLFFPPFVFIIPLVMAFLRGHRDAYQWFFKLRRFPWVVVLAGTSLVAGYYLANWLFPDFDYRSAEPFARLYFGLHVAAAISILTPLVVIKTRSRSHP